MKHYYFYLIPGQWSTDTTQMYRVQLGASKRDNAFLLTFTAISEQFGHFFNLWTDKAADLFLSCQKHVFAGENTLAEISPAMLKKILNQRNHNHA